MDVFHVFRDRLYKGKYNPVREYDCDPMDIVDETQDNKDGYEYCHDIELNCSGNTFEEAVIRLANLMNENEYYQKMFRDDDDGSKAFRI